jgi:hypothetical protein
VPEVWIIDRDSKVPEVYVLTAGLYVLQSSRPEGWIVSGATGIELRPGAPGKLAMRLVELPFGGTPAVF